MKANEYLTKRIEEIKEQENGINKTIKFQKKLDSLNKIGRVALAILGGMLIAMGTSGTGIALIAGAVANHLAVSNRGKIENNKLAQLKREEEHIKKVQQTPINGSEEMTVKRVNKVNELAERKEKAESKRKFATITSGLSTAAEIVTVLAALSNPSIGWTAIIAVIAKYITNKNKLEACSEDDLLALRLNNLNLDLILTRAIAPQERATGETQDERVEINEKSKQASYSLEDEMLVDKYIESLARIDEEKKVKQYVK